MVVIFRFPFGVSLFVLSHRFQTSRVVECLMHVSQRISLGQVASEVFREALPLGFLLGWFLPLLENGSGGQRVYERASMHSHHATFPRVARSWLFVRVAINSGAVGLPLTKRPRAISRLRSVVDLDPSIHIACGWRG